MCSSDHINWMRRYRHVQTHAVTSPTAETLKRWKNKYHNFTATKPMWQKQWRDIDTYLFPFSIDPIEFSMILQSSCSEKLLAIYLYVRLQSRYRREMRTPWLYQNLNFRRRIERCFSSDVWHISQAPAKWNMIMPKGKPEWDADYIYSWTLKEQSWISSVYSGLYSYPQNEVTGVYSDYLYTNIVVSFCLTKFGVFLYISLMHVLHRISAGFTIELLLYYRGKLA